MTYEEIAEKMPEEYAARKKDKLGYRYPSGESYLDVIQRLEPVIIEIERQKDSVCVVAHQAILRVIYGKSRAAFAQSAQRRQTLDKSLNIRSLRRLEYAHLM